MPSGFKHKCRYLRNKIIPKGNGEVRSLLVPTGKLKELQQDALKYLTSVDPDTGQYPIQLFDCHTAFKRGASAYQNAQVHVGYRMSVKFDIKGFFDSIPTTRRSAAKRRHFIFRHLGAFANSAKANATRSYATPTPKPRKLPAFPVRKTVRVMSVQEALVLHAIPTDIATFIADIAGWKGKLYQGSPLSPLLANLVTREILCKRLLKLAAVYNMPVFSVRGDKKYLVVSFAGDKLWTHGFSPEDKDLQLIKELVTETRVHPSNPLPWGTYTEFCVMTKQCPEETDEQMLLRYGALAWKPGKSGAVKGIRKHFTRKTRRFKVKDEHGEDVAKPRSFSYSAFRIWPKAKTVFTLYADDGMFSSNNPKLFMLKYVLKRILEHSGFLANKSKGIRVMKSSRYVTGYETGKCPPETKDKGARIPWRVIDQKYRRPLHHLKVGRLPLTIDFVHSFSGKLAYLQQSNLNSWKKYAAEFRDTVRSLSKSLPQDQRDSMYELTERYEHL